MRRRNELLVENDIPISDTQRQHVCSACGHIMIPGSNNQQQQDTLEIKTEKEKKTLRRSQKRSIKTSSSRTTQQQQRQQTLPTPTAVPPPPRARATPGGISKVMTCGACSRKTSIKLEGPKRISRVRKAKLESSKALVDGRKLQQQGPAEPVKPSSSSSAANANSKKRAKNRKAGLQALLDQKRSSASLSSSGFGLSLSDFMKK